MRTLLFTFIATAGVLAASRPDQVRITAHANVTLRQRPNAEAPAIAQVPLGTELAEAGPSGMDTTWLHVRLPDAREGWVSASLTRALDPARRWRTVEQIAADRLGRQGDGFAALAELADFVEREAPSPDPETRARIELLQLRAISATAAAIPRGRSEREPYAAWVGRHKALVDYNEPAGMLMLSNKAIWQVHDRSAGTQAADEIAWLSVTTGLPGECEGFLTCYVEWRNRLEGEYLRKHPLGQHAFEAVARVKDVADRLSAPASPRAMYDFDRARDCKDLSAGSDALRSAIAGTNTSNKDAAIQSLSGLRERCK